MTACMGIDMSGNIPRELPEGTREAVVNVRPRIRDIIAGMILLAARGKEPMPLETIHRILHAMKSHESILSGIRFSLTGAVCYSRDVDQAITYLTDGGFLEIVGGSAIMGGDAPGFVNHLAKFLTNSQIQAVHSASIRFHERVRRDFPDPRRSR